MNKILIVGHGSTRYLKLEKMLNQFGMACALPSYTHSLLPQEVTQKLIQASKKNASNAQAAKIRHLTDVVEAPCAELTYAQSRPKKIWDNLAFDVLLGNIDQPLWGWADEQAIHVLEYWAQFDEDMAFVLAYDRPDDLIQHMLLQQQAGRMSEDELGQHLQEWVAYNKALLAFYQKHPNRCLLVNATQMLTSANQGVQSIAQKIEWQVEIDTMSSPVSAATVEHELSQIQPLVDHLTEQVIEQQPQVAQLFDRMQQVADFPLVIKRKPTSALMLLQGVLGQHAHSKQIENQLQDAKGQNATLAAQIQKNTHDHQRAVAMHQRQLHDQQTENQLVIAQLHQTQEALEKHYMSAQQAQEQLQTVKQEAQSIKQHAAQLAQSKQRLEQQVQERQTKAEQEIAQYKQQAKKAQAEFVGLQNQFNQLQNNQQIHHLAKQENEMLIAQLHQVQEELERYYLENQRLKLEQSQMMQPAKPTYYGAADRVKQDLPYRLGATMVSHSKSTKDLAKLPFALAKEYQAFKKLDESQQELPSLEEYQDASEAEKVKKHLSYKLGKALVDGVKSPKSILDLPVKMGKEIVGFKK